MVHLGHVNEEESTNGNPLTHSDLLSNMRRFIPDNDDEDDQWTGKKTEDSGIEGKDIEGKDKEKVIKEVDEVDEDNQRTDQKVENRQIDGRDKAKSIKGIDEDD